LHGDPEEAGVTPRSARFRLRPAWLAVAVAGCAVFVALGNWQSRRAEEKLAAQRNADALAAAAPVRLPAAPVTASEYVGRRVFVAGEYVPAHTVLIDNRVHKGVAGYYVVTPLRIEGGPLHVLVNRGWVPAGPRRDRLPDVAVPAGPQRVEGIALEPSRRTYALAPDEAPGPVRQHLAIERVAAESGLRLQPVVVQQTGAAPDGLVRAWERPDAGVDTHRAYAVQWYALAVLTAVIYIAVGFKRDGDRA
jgi:surfeit locus 1 family protein